MTNYLVNDVELTATADAIREKLGDDDPIEWESGNGFAEAIAAISGGGGEAFAAIRATYPEGSVCTATNGTITLTASNTSGRYLFPIPEPDSLPEIWTVSCTDGNHHDSFTISVTEASQVFLRTLAYISSVLNDNSWAIISEVAQRGEGDTWWDVGDAKEIVLNGTVGTLSLANFATCVFILDFNHVDGGVADNNIIFGGFKSALSNGVDTCLCDSKYSTNQAGATKYFNMNHYGSTSNSPYNTNYGGWAGCDLRYDILGGTSTPPSVYGKTKTSANVGYDATQDTIDTPVAKTLMAALPEDFRSVLKLRSHYTDNTGNSSDLAGNVTAIVDAVALLAEFEIYGERSRANHYEKNKQTQMLYYKNGNSKVRYKHNAASTAARWWMGSPDCKITGQFCLVFAAGSPNGQHSCYSSGLAPAFKV